MMKRPSRAFPERGDDFADRETQSSRQHTGEYKDPHGDRGCLCISSISVHVVFSASSLFSFTVFIAEIVNRTSRTSHGRSRSTTARENCKWRI